MRTFSLLVAFATIRTVASYHPLRHTYHPDDWFLDIYKAIADESEQLQSELAQNMDRNSSEYLQLIEHWPISPKNLQWIRGYLFLVDGLDKLNPRFGHKMIASKLPKVDQFIDNYLQTTLDDGENGPIRTKAIRKYLKEQRREKAKARLHYDIVKTKEDAEEKGPNWFLWRYPPRFQKILFIY
ncbi:hypothetical protein L596_016693 [Steinernema carpocapsae]|uniref:Uncharacterized protein n=1 Tax=Steinernema carpocapsae TaxID=34508 RepID=A0A4U5NJS2_STECR|nr:hypothetical protein L596_016693 [Steinernema carpocapsae]